MHLSITLANDQLGAQIFNTFITILYLFRAISCLSSGQIVLTHCGRVTQICFFNTVKLGTLQVLLSATPQGGMFPEVSHPQALLGSLVSIS